MERNCFYNIILIIKIHSIKLSTCTPIDKFLVVSSELKILLLTVYS